MHTLSVARAHVPAPKRVADPTPEVRVAAFENYNKC